MKPVDEITLTGEQKKVLTFPFKGPVLIKGGAGSGKTLVAVARAEQMKKVHPERKVAVFTYTKELVSGIKQMAQDGVVVFGFDKWVYDFLKKKRWVQEKVLQKALYNAKKMAFVNDVDRAISRKSDDFYRAEISWLKGRLISSLEEYKKTPRAGRGTVDRVTKDDRELLWKMFVEYNSFLKQNQAEDWDDRVIDALEKVKAKGFVPYFDHIVIDEAQDFSFARISLLRKLVRKETDSITIVADVAQQIYQSGFSWSDVGLNVRGRSFEFTHNYRNTKQIAAAAYALMASEQDKTDYTNMSLPSREGEKPLVVLNSSDGTLVQILRDRKDRSNSVVAVPKRRDVNKMKETLSGNGIRGVHVTTYHSLKGLQFDHVYLFDLTAEYFPLSNLDDEEISKTRKLIYVAMTRARKTLTMFTDSEPIQFINEIRKDCLTFKEMENAND